MFKEFLETFSKIVEIMPDPSITDSDNELVKKMTEAFPRLSDKEKELFREVIKSFDDLGFENRLYFDLFCLHNFKDPGFAEDILDVLITEQMDVARRYNYLFALNRELFLSGIRADYGKRLAIEKSMVSEIRNKAELFPEYIPYGKRNEKNVVIVINPFLGAYHSPSLASLSLGYYLTRLGYNVYYVSVNENEIFEYSGSEVYIASLKNRLYNGITEFEYDCFGFMIRGLHFDLRKDHMADDINALAVHISRMAPEFVIGVEGCNILADICSLFTDVVLMNIVDDLPVTLTDITMRYFAGELQNDYINASKYGKVIFDAVFQNAFQPFNQGEETAGLPEDRFLVCLVGNRLDEEINNKMQETILTVLREVPEADMVFIGECPKTRERFSEVTDRCHFLGYVDRCEDTIAMCSVFLNPPRRGGGGGGYMAVKRGIPVYSLNNCDVASCVGNDFSHDTYDELIPFIRRCIDEDGYYELMKKKAVEAYESIFGDDSCENIRVFCDRLTDYLKRKDEDLNNE